MESRLEVMEKKMGEMEEAVFAKGDEARSLTHPESCRTIEWYQAWVQCQAKRVSFDPSTRTGAFLCPVFPLICMHDPEREFPFQWMRLPSWVNDATIKWPGGLMGATLYMDSIGNNFWSVPSIELAQGQGTSGGLMEKIPPEFGAMKKRVINVSMIKPEGAPLIICTELPGSCPETLTVEFLCLYPCFPVDEAENYHTPTPRYSYEDHKVLSMHRFSARTQSEPF